MFTASDLISILIPAPIQKTGQGFWARLANGNVCAQWLSRIELFATLWTVVCQAPLSVGFSRKGS